MDAADLRIHVVSTDEEIETVIRRRADGSEDELEKPNGFTATQTLELRSRDLPRALRAVRALASTDLGVDVEAGDPSCSYAAIDKVRTELLAAAQADVRVRAGSAVAAIGRARLGMLVTTDLGEVTYDGLEDASLAACEDGVTATATVNATYRID